MNDGGFSIQQGDQVKNKGVVD